MTPAGIVASRRRGTFNRAVKGGKWFKFDPEQSFIYIGGKKATLGGFAVGALDCLKYEHGYTELDAVYTMKRASTPFIEGMAVEWLALTEAECDRIRSGELTLEGFGEMMGVR